MSKNRNKIVLVLTSITLGLVAGLALAAFGEQSRNRTALAACNAYCDTAPEEISKMICNSQCEQIIIGSNCLRFPPTEVTPSEE